MKQSSNGAGVQLLYTTRSSQYSPLRYPGGKSWLVPLALRWLAQRPHKRLLEPFAGGASVGLAIAASGLVDEVVLVEIDPDVCSFWRAILHQSHELAMMVLALPKTEGALLGVLASPPRRPVEAAFQVLVRNRIARGGVLAPGAGILNSGEDGKGLVSRWYPATIAERIERIGAMSERIELIQGCGLDEWERRIDDCNTAVFADPPYTLETNGTGHRLYANSDLDHDRLLELAASTAGDVVVTYNRTAPLIARTSRAGLESRIVAMVNAHCRASQELLIGRDLTWLPDDVSDVSLERDDKSPVRRDTRSFRPRKRDHFRVLEALRSRPEYSDRVHAGEIGVTAKTVAAARRELERQGRLRVEPARIGADGIRRPPAGTARRKVLEHLADRPDDAGESDRSLARRLEVSRATVAAARIHRLP